MTNKSTDPKQEQKDNIFNGPHETMGQYLQHGRIEQEKTLDAVSESTCIHIATIKALEEDDYEKLPAEVFVRGFIKIYANHLNLDADKALSLFQPAPGPDTDAFSKRKGYRQRILPGERLAEASPFTTSRQLLIFILICLLTFFAYKVFFSNNQSETDIRETATVTEETILAETDQQESPPEQTAPEQILADTAAIPSVEDAALPASPKLKQETFKTEQNPTEAQTTPPVAAQIPSTPAAVIITPTEEPTEPTEPAKPQAEAPVDAPTERLVIVPHKKKITHKPKVVITEEPAAGNKNDLLAETSAPPLPADSPAEPPANDIVPVTTTTADTNEPTKKNDTAKKPAHFAYTLKATFTDLTWLEVTLDNGSLRAYTFRSGSKWEWQARKEIKLNIGNAGGVHLTLNNKSLPPLGETGESIEITLPSKSR